MYIKNNAVYYIVLSNSKISSADLSEEKMHIFSEVTTLDLKWKSKMYHKVVIKFFNLILTDVNGERGGHSADESSEV